MSAINQFPGQEAILRHLADQPHGEPVAAAEIAEATGLGGDNLEAVNAEIQHLVGIGLARRVDAGVELTDEGRTAAARLP